MSFTVQSADGLQFIFEDPRVTLRYYAQSGMLRIMHNPNIR